MPEIKGINSRIKLYRSYAGFTQADVARELGMKRNTYGRMELHGNPKPEILIKLAKLFNVSVEILLFGYDSSKEKPQDETDGASSDILRPEDLTAKHSQMVFKEDIKSELAAPVFTPTNSEINLIKAYRSIPKAKQQEIRELLERFYHDNKKA